MTTMPPADPSAALERQLVASALSPSVAQKRLALGVVIVVLSAACLLMGPLSGIHLGANRTFVAVYLTAMFVTDAVTATLLYSQFAVLRSWGVLVIASGYLFTALVVALYFLAFPGLLPSGQAFDGLQTAPWLYVTWHCGFGLFVIAYALTKDPVPGAGTWRGETRPAILVSVVSTFALAMVAGAAVRHWEPELPRIVVDEVHFSPDWPYLIGVPIVSTCATALVLLWLRRRSVLDLWLMVVLLLFIIEQPLSRYPSPMRFSLGWYAVRVISFLSSSIVLVVLLYEITTLYPRLLSAVLAQRRERHARLATGDAVAASIVHEIRQPLTAMVTAADAGLLFLERAAPDVDRAKEAFRRISADGHRAGSLVVAIRASYKSDVGDRAPFELDELIADALRLLAADLDRHRIRVRREPGRQVPPVRGNRLQIQQVLLNLVTNAIDAMAGRDDPRILSVATRLQDDQRVLVSVADTGVGVPVSDAHRVFDPLFSTKADGMGMGLSICRAIIEAHDGRLWFEPHAPRGTVFHFTLDADAPASTPA